jgi:hypothetical protein
MGFFASVGFPGGLPVFPAYVFVALGLKGDPTPVVILAGTPLIEPTEREVGSVGPQLASTFEPV